MKLLVLLAIVACVAANPSKKMILPRLPLSVMMSGNYQLIPDDKIVGGTPVEPNSLPFQISLMRRGILASSAFSHSCGGSILDATTILNAAHCVDGINNFARLRVVAGDHTLSDTTGNEQTSDVANVIMHASYSSSTYENDIAIIKLVTPLDLSGPTAQPVNLPESQSEPAVGSLLTVSGWGTTSAGGSISDVLLKVDVPVVSDAECETKYGAGTILPSMLCAGDTTNGGIDSCQGDSGGPLFAGSGTTAVQHGIVSWGQGCADALYPGVYTQVSYFLDWIAANRV